MEAASFFFRRDGTPYPPEPAGTLEWAKDIRDHEKKIVRQETLPNGLFVSTVWLGIDHGFGRGPPIIFETIVFRGENELKVLDQRRYSTEDEAIVGHEYMVTTWKFLNPSKELPEA